MEFDETKHNRDLIKIMKQHLRALEKQAAYQGAQTPAHITIEIEQIREKIRTTENNIRNSSGRKGVKKPLQQKERSFDILEDPALNDQVRQLFDAVRAEIKRLTYIELCEELVEYLKESSDEAKIAIYMPFIRSKLSDIIDKTYSERGLFLWAKVHHMMGEYESCVDFVHSLTSISEKSEYYFLGSDASFQSAHISLGMLSKLDIIDESSKTGLDYSKQKTQEGRNYLEKARELRHKKSDIEKLDIRLRELLIEIQRFESLIKLSKEQEYMAIVQSDESLREEEQKDKELQAQRQTEQAEAMREFLENQQQERELQAQRQVELQTEQAKTLREYLETQQDNVEDSRSYEQGDER